MALVGAGGARHMSAMAYQNDPMRGARPVGAACQLEGIPALHRLGRAAAGKTGIYGSKAWAIVTLRDGSRVRIRRLNRHDAALEHDFIARLSPESTYLRFFGAVKANDALTRQLTDLDYRRDMAFVALADEDGAEREVGVSRYAMVADGKTCECAITIRDDWQGRGLAVILMRLLADVARRRGVESMVAIRLRENTGMRELAEFLGFQPESNLEDPSTVIHRLPLQPLAPALRHERG